MSERDPRIEHNPLPDKPLWITQTDVNAALDEVRNRCPVERNPKDADANIYRTAWHDAVQAFHRHLIEDVARYPY